MAAPTTAPVAELIAPTIALAAEPTAAGGCREPIFLAVEKTLANEYWHGERAMRG
jgi:hypothetical protein